VICCCAVCHHHLPAAAAAAAATVDDNLSDPGYSSPDEAASDCDGEGAIPVHHHATANQHNKKQRQQLERSAAAAEDSMASPSSSKQHHEEEGTGSELKLVSSYSAGSQSLSSHGVTIEMLRTVGCDPVLCCAVLP
jgi:hypothetical protein